MPGSLDSCLGLGLAPKGQQSPCDNSTLAICNTDPMSYSVLVRDEPLGGQARDVLTLEFLTKEVTIKELIEERVHQEVRDYNAKSMGTPVFQGLVQPTGSEAELNGYRMKEPRLIDWKPQAEKALAAFSENGFLVLIGERQAESLSERVVIAPGTAVSFVKMTPLVGG